MVAMGLEALQPGRSGFLLELPPFRARRRPLTVRATIRQSEVESLNKHFAIEGVEIRNGRGGLPKAVLSTAQGSSAEVYFLGACATSWKTSADEELLYVRPDAVFDGSKPISGGIPLCFPQFGPGAMQQHGFARNVPWTLATTENSTGSPSLSLELEPSDYTRAMWDCNFKVVYKITLHENSLRTYFHVNNKDQKEISFTAALHTYFHAAAADACVGGLKGCKTLNKDPDPKNPSPGVEKRSEVTFSGFYDCMYLDAPKEISLENGLGQTIAIRNTGWTDAVLWNPYLTMKDSYAHFVCVENAKLNKVILQPGEAWAAEQVMSVVR